MLERNVAWIAQAEVKVAVIISLDAGMIGAAAAAYTTTSNKTIWAIVLSVFFGLLVIASLFCSARAVSPITGGPDTSFIFFKTVSQQSGPDYASALLAATDAALFHDLAAQIHRNAQIATIKHGWVSKALFWSFLAAAFWICAISQLVK